jgi:ABC-2 type transport system permease protein
MSVIAFSYIMIQSACAYDDKNKSDVLLKQPAVKRGTIVIARYISTFVFAAISIVYYIILSGIVRVHWNCLLKYTLYRLRALQEYYLLWF